MVRFNNLKQAYGIGAAPKGQQLDFFAGEKPVIQPASTPAGEIKYQVIDTPAALTQLVNRLDKASRISFDTETTSTDQMRADLVGISLAVDGDQGYYIPVGHSPGLGEQLPLASVLEALRGPLTDARIPKIGHLDTASLLSRYGCA
jgi:DNA polymerase-1